MYKVAKYWSDETKRARWAVFDTETYVWHFPNKYGKKAAKALEVRMMIKAGLI